MQNPIPSSRKAGRPPKNRGADDSLPIISKELCIARAYELCDTIDIQDLSLSLLAKTVGVSPTTIRHHVRNRKILTPALLKLFFTEVVERFPPFTGHWQTDLDNFMVAYMSVKLRKRGFATYFFEQRFSKELDPFSSTPAQTVVGRALTVFRKAGLTTRDAALAWHLMIHLLSSIAYTNARGLTPADHAAFFETLARPDKRTGDDRSVLVALQFITMPMMFEIISGMLKHAVDIKFKFAETAVPLPKKLLKVQKR